MITIAAIFSTIGYMEWQYLRRNNRKKKTIWIVMGIAFFLFLSMEAIYILRDRWTIAIVIEYLFDPIQKMLFIGT
jgi:hypothetical protein